MGWGTGNIGGGSGGLNFKIVGGTSEPSAPRENTIWVNTDQKITGYYFYATQPENMAEGEVWFAIGAVSDVAFSATKKNPIMVYPLTAKQYINGALESKNAQTYRDGEWVSWWEGYLYDAGNEYSAVTGGWVVTPIGRSAGTGFNYEIEKGESSITIPGVSQKGCIVHPANKIDLNGKETLTFTGTLTPASTAGRYSFIGIWTEFGSTNADNLVASFDVTKETSGTQTIVISGLNESYYIGIAVHGLSSSAEMEMMKVE